MTVPPWTLPPKLTSVGSARKRNVIERRAACAAIAVISIYT
jgi:hypothetical protein